MGVYDLLFRRTSTFVATIMASTFFFERTFELGSEYMFNKVNEGKLWAHIKHKYE
ncbi:cytochrome b-c1 complex subunit 9 [Ctenocephalides felis]|uniref:cytochrome b-c1 complex subunit 9 n=1 Tax=Ctenocephalides felis TaxID=7515 RepID=UPI000E6E125B|nr:cytochrome b-c1 complex subunit 9 [Ctenocephalides felis]